MRSTTDVQIGKVVGGMDWGLTDSKGVFSPDAIYVLETADNATIAVFEKGYAPNVHILFETSSSKYAWLNSAVAYAGGGPFEGGVALDVWQVSIPTGCNDLVADLERLDREAWILWLGKQNLLW